MKVDSNPISNIPPGYGMIPTLENGMPDLSKAIWIDTPFGKQLYMPIDTHPYVESFIEKTIAAGYMNPDGSWSTKVPKGAWGIWITVYYEMVGAFPDWKFFEEKWKTKNLQQNMIKKETINYERWYNKFYDLLSSN